MLQSIDYKQEMRNFVSKIAAYARKYDANFLVIPQNGIELVTSDGEEASPVQTQFLATINGWGQEDLFYGHEKFDIATKLPDTRYLIKYLNIAKRNNITILVTDYCLTPLKMNTSYVKNSILNYLSFAANNLNLNTIPWIPLNPINENSADVTSLKEAKNFLYLINPEKYSTTAYFLDALKATNYDVLIIDMTAINDDLTRKQINALKTKKNGGKRLVLAYMSIGEAENYRYIFNIDLAILLLVRKYINIEIF